MRMHYGVFAAAGRRPPAALRMPEMVKNILCQIEAANATVLPGDERSPPMKSDLIKEVAGVVS